MLFLCICIDIHWSRAGVFSSWFENQHCC